MTQSPLRLLASRLVQALLAFSVVLLVGTLGYHWLESWGWIDSFYMTVITLTTVGFGEVHPLSPPGRLFTVGLLFSGVGTASYAAILAGQFLLEPGLRRAMGRRVMDRKLDHLDQHIIVCGYGRVGREICEELQRRRAQFVVIEQQPEEEEFPHGLHYIVGDATEDAILERAHIRQARSLISALSNEADNVLLTLSARQLNPRIFITARADSDEMDRKLTRAGANRVVVPYKAGAQRMAVTTLQPNVFEFISLLTADPTLNLILEEVRVERDSEAMGKSLLDLDLRRRFEIMVIALRRPGGRPTLNPPVQQAIELDDSLLIVGHPDNVRRFTDQCKRPASS